jgi:hypothetical protein
MSFMLITGIILVAVPFILMLGFAAFIFVSFMKDDDDTTALLNIALIIMALGLILIGAHFLKQVLI